MILIVDDKAENLFSLKSLLQLYAYETDTAASGEEALRKILKNEYSVIILDVQMPHMDGYELARRIRASGWGRDLVLIVGGLFLVAKSTMEIHEKLEGHEGEKSERVAHSYASVLAQIMALDIVFSLDSVITAVGMVQHVAIMIAAVIAAVLVMMVFAKPIGDFVSRRPTVKMLALAFLLVIGMMLITDGFGHHVPKGYIYFAMAFSLFVEMLNLRARHREEPVHLRQPYVEEGGDSARKPGA
jgi:CheY-like chemotaxis protein